jgi:FkbM family methyltransferase
LQIIYDFGCNNGDDIPYYLLKSDLVVAVEANPVLAEHVTRRFHNEIIARRLVVLNCVLSDTIQPFPVPFYIHRHEHVRSQYLRPPENELRDFDAIAVMSRKPSDIIREFGEPHYVKIDVEGYDHVVLREVFSAGIRPRFISAESHHIEVFASIVSLGGYKAFKLVDGPGVGVRYGDCVINTRHGQQRYSFPTHSAGPFGEDISGPWIAADNFFKLLAMVGLGWKDVHAARDVEVDPGYAPPIRLVCDY